jgi:hypothetical protein
LSAMNCRPIRIKQSISPLRAPNIHCEEGQKMAWIDNQT